MATIAEKSRTKEIIDRMQTILDTAPSVPLAAGKISIYKDEMQTLLTELASQMEIELKTYHEVNDRKGKIISEAKKEAEKIIYHAERTASRMRVSKHTTGVAPIDYSTLTEEEISALGNANEIYAASLIYTDEMLTEVTDMITDAYHNIRSDYEIILQAFEEKLNLINNNRAELMDGLQEMDEADRSQQMLEIGQLLSNELYTSRMKAKMNSDEYDDGSIQLSLDLQEEQKEKTRQAEEKAQRAEEELLRMIAERDALAQKVETLKMEGATSMASMNVATMGTPSASVATMGMASASVSTMGMASASVATMGVPSANVSTMGMPSVNGSTMETPSMNAPSVDMSSSESEIDEEEYEIVYVTEDELEEGEEYEIEYVDEIEDEEIENDEIEVEKIENKEIENEKSQDEGTEDSVSKESYADVLESKPVNTADKMSAEKTAAKLEEKKQEKESIPVISNFKKSESMALVSSEKVAKMATAITTEPKYSGLISRAVKQREQAELNETVKVEETSVAASASTKEESVLDNKVPKEASKEKTDKNETSKEKTAQNEASKEKTVPEKDEDIRIDVNGKEYVQATMTFDENFEITEF